MSCWRLRPREFRSSQLFAQVPAIQWSPKLPDCLSLPVTRQRFLKRFLSYCAIQRGAERWAKRRAPGFASTLGMTASWASPPHTTEAFWRERPEERPTLRIKELAVAYW